MALQKLTQAEMDFSRGGDLEDADPMMQNFREFIGEDSLSSPNRSQEVLSNLIEEWFEIPKYCLNARTQNKLRKGGVLPSHTRKFGKNGAHKMTMSPARIVDSKTGEEKEYFPTPTDEVIEYVLIKLLTDPSHGAYADIEGSKHGIVRFKLIDIEKLLLEHGIKKNRADIKHSLRVLAKTDYTIHYNGSKRPLHDRIIAGLHEGGNNDLWTARFSLVVSGAIPSLTYRQFPISAYLHLALNPSRWILSRMMMQKNLGEGYPHKFTLQEAVEQGVVNCSNTRDNVRIIRDAISELHEKGYLDANEKSKLNITRIREQGKTTDVRWEVPCSNYMLRHSLKANKRAKDTKIMRTRNAALPAFA